MNASQLSAVPFCSLFSFVVGKEKEPRCLQVKQNGSEKMGSPVPPPDPALCPPGSLVHVAASFLGAVLWSHPPTPGQLLALTGFLETFFPFNCYCFVFLYF